VEPELHSPTKFHCAEERKKEKKKKIPTEIARTTTLEKMVKSSKRKSG
jgi:hypothetical protein